MSVKAVPSPNFNDRPRSVDTLVLHYTGMESGQTALDRMCDPGASVSAHYMVWENGDIVQLVGEDKRAWHAGVSEWMGETDLNDRSIGIEIVNGGHDWPLEGGTLPPYPAAQIEAVIALCKGIVQRWNIPQTRVAGHSDIAPTRKDDPGEHFPWQRLSEEGIGLWPETIGEVDEAFEFDLALADIGYDMAVPGAAVRAFQRRFRPTLVNGAADAETVSLIAEVASLYSAETS